MKCRSWMLCTAITLFALASSVPLSAQKETGLYSFTGANGDGAYPEAGLVFDRQGNLYGTTSVGGDKGCGALLGCGTVFKLTPEGHEKVLYTFCPGGYPCTDGYNPVAGLVLDWRGNLYGTTFAGGVTGCGPGCGTIFKVTPEGHETVLYSFCPGGYPCTDGYNPAAGLVLDWRGNLYGTTLSGGASGWGTVFKVTPEGHETVLYSFTGGADGGVPYADLVLDRQGNLYGTTSVGGDKGCGSFFGCGTVFKVTPEGHETVLHSFTAANGDGAEPYAGLVFDWRGNLYGTTLSGGGTGCGSGCGTVFKVTPEGHETVLYTFTGGTDGGMPYAGLVFDWQENLYGTTSGGGASNGGTVFKLTSEGREIVLHSFTESNGVGAEPYAGLAFDWHGNLYGTTLYGGDAGCGDIGCGTVFKVTH